MGFLEFINNIIITIFMFFIGGISGIIYGFFIGIAVYFISIYKYMKKKKTKTHAFNEMEPAYEIYFFCKQYRDLKNIFWSSINRILNGLSLSNFICRESDYYIVNCFKCFFRTGRKISELIVGFLAITLFFVLHLAIITILSIPVYCLFIVISTYEKYCLWKSRVYTICPNCFTKFRYPYYLCPTCGCVHKNLKPGKYGILKRKCLCGTKIPVVHFRKKDLMKCQCPHCNEIFVCRDSSPFCVSIIGGESAGKTSLTYAGVNDLIKEVNKKSWKMHFRNAVEEEKIMNVLNYYNEGRSIEKNKNENLINLYLDLPNISFQKAFYIFDESDENFRERSFFVNRKYFKYIDGLIIVIDPLTFKETNEFRKQSKDNAGDLLDKIILNLRKIHDLKIEQSINIPTAVVINKMDLFNYVGDIEQFIKEKGEENLIRKLEYNFNNYKIFSISSLGHDPNGMPFRSEGVKEVAKWIFKQNIDGGVAK